MCVWGEEGQGWLFFIYMRAYKEEKQGSRWGGKGCEGLVSMARRGHTSVNGMPKGSVALRRFSLSDTELGFSEKRGPGLFLPC